MAATIGDNTVVAVINGTGNMQPDGIAAQVITFAAALITVGLRFLARRLAGIKLGRDDWLVLMAMVVGFADFGVICWWFAIGGGKYIGEVTPARLHQTIVIILLVELFWATIMFLVRASALILWYNIFPQPWVRKFCRFWRLLNFLFYIASVLITCLQCNPPWLFFYPLEAPPGACMGTKRPYTALGVISIVLDAVVIALPTTLVLRLQLTRAMKLTVCALILTGSLTIIFTIIRIVVLRRSDLSGPAALNTTWVYAEVGYWIGAESYIAIVSACLPCLRPVLSRVVPRSWVPKSLLQGSASVSASASASRSRSRSRSGLQWSGMRMSAMQRAGGSENKDTSRAGSGAGLHPGGSKKWIHPTVTGGGVGSKGGGSLTPLSMASDRSTEPAVEADMHQRFDEQDPTMKMLPPEPTLDYSSLETPAGSARKMRTTTGRPLDPLGWLPQDQQQQESQRGQQRHQWQQKWQHHGRRFHRGEEVAANNLIGVESGIQVERSIEIRVSRNEQKSDNDSTFTSRSGGPHQPQWV